MVIVQPLPAFGFESDFFDLIMWRGGSNFCQIHRAVPDFRYLFGGRSGSGNDWGSRSVRPRETNSLAGEELLWEDCGGVNLRPRRNGSGYTNTWSGGGAAMTQ